jgi:hypothetical protein
MKGVLRLGVPGVDVGPGDIRFKTELEDEQWGYKDSAAHDADEEGTDGPGKLHEREP